MDGEVIYFDNERGVGFATGGDGNRYVFDRGDAAGQDVAKGAKIEFRPEGDRARAIVVRASARGRTVAETADDVPATAEPDRSGSGVPVQDTPGNSLISYFGQAVTRNYANFRGRARRKEYWGFALFAVILVVFAGLAGFTAGMALGYEETEEPVWTALATSAMLLVLFIPALAVTVRRQHDIGLSGWFLLLSLIPTVGSLIILVFTLIPSQRHANRWGPVPAGIRTG